MSNSRSDAKTGLSEAKAMTGIANRAIQLRSS
jgi:hypothetical protein